MKQPTMPIEIYRKLADRVDFGAECKAARKIFQALGLNTKQRKAITGYCLDQGIIREFTGSEPEVAVFALKAAMRQLRPNKACSRVNDYVLGTAIDRDWYVEAVYPAWSGAVTAVVDPEGSVLFAVHADDLTGVAVPFRAHAYTGETHGAHVYLVQQQIQVFVGAPLREDERAQLEELFNDWV
jgi:hypothetical protein